MHSRGFGQKNKHMGSNPEKQAHGQHAGKESQTFQVRSFRTKKKPRNMKYVLTFLIPRDTMYYAKGGIGWIFN